MTNDAIKHLLNIGLEIHNARGGWLKKELDGTYMHQSCYGYMFATQDQDEAIWSFLSEALVEP